MNRTININNPQGFPYRFGFNGKEQDFSIATVDGANLDFGAREYDSRIGRWWAVDPLAAKYPNMSPYIFGGDNPILNVDIDGREIWITHRVEDKKTGKTLMQTVQYKNGELRNEDGSVYKGNNAYFNTVKGQLNQLKKDNIEEVSLILKELETNDFKNDITNSGEIAKTKDNQSNINPSIFNIFGDDTEIQFDAFSSADPETDGKTNRNPRVGLIHELKHSYDINKGELRSGTIKNQKLENIKLSEIDAIKVENKVRDKTKDNLKTTSDGKEIPRKYNVTGK